MLLAPLIVAGTCSTRSAKTNLKELSEKTIEESLVFLTNAPHPFGSSNQQKVRDGISDRLKKHLWEVEVDAFSAETPNPVLLKNPNAPTALTIKKDGFNIYAHKDRKAKCIVVLASHYDTKHFDEFPYVGANDSGSSTAALIAIAETLSNQPSPQNCAIELWFFDGEEAVLTDWSSGETVHPAKIPDHTYGSRHAAGKLNKTIKALILLDMIGSQNLHLTLDSNSTPALTERVLELASEHNLEGLFSKRRTPVEDDHIPFLKKGIPAIDLIDFNNLDFWHRPGDVHSTISVSNIKKVSQLALILAEDQAANP